MTRCKSFVIANGQVKLGVPEETDRKTARRGAPSDLWPLGTALTSVIKPWIESNGPLQDGKGNTSASQAKMNALQTGISTTFNWVDRTNILTCVNVCRNIIPFEITQRMEAFSIYGHFGGNPEDESPILISQMEKNYVKYRRDKKTNIYKNFTGSGITLWLRVIYNRASMRNRKQHHASVSVNETLSVWDESLLPCKSAGNSRHARTNFPFIRFSRTRWSPFTPLPALGDVVEEPRWIGSVIEPDERV